MDLPTPPCVVPPSSRLSLLLPLCSGALFLSALILFAIEPMFTKMVLPLLGGTPAVWNTAVMFFQAVLLAGYLYAHLLSRLRRLRSQALIHVGVLVAGLFFLPVHVGLAWTPTASEHPVPWLIALLTISIGVPFFAISATAPLLQSWFSRSDHPHASDPYFLYVSSNLGGIVALLAYPVVIEPRFGLALQGRLWMAAYALLAALIAAFALRLWTTQRQRPFGEIADMAASLGTLAPEGLSDSVTWATRARWVALAFVPSALLLAVTLHISTDVAAAPFLWVAPLLLYSLSFILVFARRPLLKHKWMLMLQPWVYAGTALYFTEREPLCFVLPLDLLTLFMAAMVCHGELVRRRPAVGHLTEFYFWMSLGGLLGGAFCVLIAPVAFNCVLEYPLVLVLGCLLLPVSGRGWLRYSLDVALPAALAGAIYFARQEVDLNGSIVERWREWTDYFTRHGVSQRIIDTGSPILLYLVLAVVLFAFRRRPLRFTLGFGVLLASTIYLNEETNQIFRQRSFFGVYEVTTTESDPDENLYARHSLYHGTTLHGDQDMDPENLLTPRTYYDREGPLAQVFEALRAVRKIDHVGVMGLGTGTTACYHEPNETMTFFEIDPTMERIARDPKLFRYLELSGPDVKVKIGDGRQSLSRMPDGTFNLLLLDAFSSDAIPVHLLTREALTMYLQKLAPNGIVLFHISNRFVDLEPVLANLAADLRVAALIQNYEPTSEQESAVGACSSTWVAVAPNADDLRLLEADDRWSAPVPGARVGIWTDDYSNIFRTLIWKSW
jgi:predicted membrane-bound spermidine synthase